MADLNGIALDARFYFAASAAHQFQSLSGKSANQCPALLRKIFRFTFHPNHLYISSCPAHTRGAFRDRHERWVRDAMDARSAKDESARLADGEAVWS
jgi:hypothetical protein